MIQTLADKCNVLYVYDVGVLNVLGLCKLKIYTENCSVVKHPFFQYHKNHKQIKEDQDS